MSNNAHGHEAEFIQQQMAERVPSEMTRIQSEKPLPGVSVFFGSGAPLTEYEKELLDKGDPDLGNIVEWFTYHSPTPEQQERYQLIRQGAMMFARTLVVCCPRSADRTAALRKLRECVMTANASIALEVK